MLIVLDYYGLLSRCMQAAGQCAWFLKIAFAHDICVCVCVFIPGSELLITSSVMWTPHDWLN